MKLYEKLIQLQATGDLKRLIDAGVIAPKALTVIYVCSVSDNGGYGAVKRLCREMRMSRRTYYNYKKYGYIEV
jgi:hypothetical protein